MKNIIKLSDIKDNNIDFKELLLYICRVIEIDVMCHETDTITYIKVGCKLYIEEKNYFANIFINDNNISITVYEYYDIFDTEDYCEFYCETIDKDVISVYKEYFINKLKSWIC